METRVDRIERLLESLGASREEDRRNRIADRERDDERFQRLEAMIESLSKSESERTVTQGERDMAARLAAEATARAARAAQVAELEATNAHSNGRNNERWKKLDIPVYNGEEDAFGWVNKLERYFRIRGAEENEKLQAVIVALDGKALSWYQWWETCNPNVSWDGFKVAIIERFQSVVAHSPFAALLALKQDGTVEEYVTQFEKFAGMVNGVGEDYLMDIFLNGLKEEVGAEVKLYEPQHLSTMMKKTLMIDQKNQAVLKTGGATWNKGGSTYKSPTYTRTVSVDTGQKSGFKGPNSPSTSVGSNNVVNSERSFNRGRTGGFKRLSEAEMQEKLRKGECFKCDEKFGPNHVCKNKQLRVMLLEEDEEIEGTEDEETITEDRGDLVEYKQLSLNSIVGFTSRRSLKVWGTIGTEKVVVLVDCGATHNFIAQDLVERLQLTVQETPTYVVEVGDGHKVKCRGMCNGVKVQIQGIDVHQNYYLFGLGGEDVVLGLEWLASLGEIRD